MYSLIIYSSVGTKAKSDLDHPLKSKLTLFLSIGSTLNQRFRSSCTVQADFISEEVPRCCPSKGSTLRGLGTLRTKNPLKDLQPMTSRGIFQMERSPRAHAKTLNPAATNDEGSRTLKALEPQPLGEGPRMTYRS